jgi:hypothetical protein
MGVPSEILWVSSLFSNVDRIVFVFLTTIGRIVVGVESQFWRVRVDEEVVAGLVYG